MNPIKTNRRQFVFDVPSGNALGPVEVAALSNDAVGDLGHKTELEMVVGDTSSPAEGAKGVCDPLHKCLMCRSCILPERRISPTFCQSEICSGCADGCRALST